MFLMKYYINLKEKKSNNTLIIEKSYVNMFYCTCGYHTCKKSYKTKLARKQHLAGVEAANTKKNYGSKKKKKKRTRFQCPGTEKTRRKNGDKIPCKKKHSIGQFIAAQKIALSEGIYLKKLERTVGSSGIVFKTGTREIPDIVTNKNCKLKFYEIKPKNPMARGEQLLRKSQEKWIRNTIKKYSVYLVYYDVNDDLIFSHSKPILLTKKNISDYSNPLNEDKEEKIKQIRCRDRINKKKLEQYTEKFTLHSHRILKKMLAY